MNIMIVILNKPKKRCIYKLILLSALSISIVNISHFQLHALGSVQRSHNYKDQSLLVRPFGKGYCGDTNGIT